MRFIRSLILTSLIMGLGSVALSAADKAPKAPKAPKTAASWEATIKKFEDGDATTPPPKGAVLLVGGSNARRWTDVADYFPQHNVINRGFGGAKLTDVLHFADRIVLPYAPRVIILNAGGNDLSSGKSPEQVREACRAFVQKVGAALPQTKIIAVSLPPVLRAATVPDGYATIRRSNALLADLAKAEPALEFIDLFPAFSGADGKPRVELFVEDGTHFSAKGYAVVAGLLREKL